MLIVDVRHYIGHWIYKTVGTSSFIRRIEWRSMFDWLDPKQGEKILDIACGNGVLSLKIAERGCKVYGIDISDNAVKEGVRLAERESIPCKFEVGSAEDLPYPDRYFDKIVCSSSLEHFKDDIKALGEMNRVLKAGGCVVMTVDSLTYPINDELKERHRELYYVMNYYTRETLKERFEIAGLRMNRSEYLLNSRITSFFFNHLVIKDYKLPMFLRVMSSLIVYPLCLVSERMFGNENMGYTLIAEGRKKETFMAHGDAGSLPISCCSNQEPLLSS